MVGYRVPVIHSYGVRSMLLATTYQYDLDVAQAKCVYGLYTSFLSAQMGYRPYFLTCNVSCDLKTDAIC